MVVEASDQHRVVATYISDIYKVFAIIHMMWIDMRIHHQHTSIITSLGLDFRKSADILILGQARRTETMPLCCDWGFIPTQSGCLIHVWSIWGVCHHSYDMDRHVNPSSHSYNHICKPSRFWKVCWHPGSRSDRNHAVMWWLRLHPNTEWLTHSCRTYIRGFAIIHMMWIGYLDPSHTATVTFVSLDFGKSHPGSSLDRNHAVMGLRLRINTE